MTAKQKELHRTTKACHIMSLIRRQNPEARKCASRQKQRESIYSSSNEDLCSIVMESSLEEDDENSNPAEFSSTDHISTNGSYSVNNSSFSINKTDEITGSSITSSSTSNTSSLDELSSWDTYWRQMKGPPPYKNMENREIFTLILKTGRDANTETRYYVEEPMERDPHSLIPDQAQAKIRIAPDVFFGIVEANWTRLRSISNEEETVLTLAVQFPDKKPMSLGERKYHSIHQMSMFLFFLYGYRHANIHNDYKKECQPDCSHLAHRQSVSRERKLPSMLCKVADLKSDLRFMDFSCIISSPPDSLSFSSDMQNENENEKKKGKGRGKKRRSKNVLKPNRYQPLKLKITASSNKTNSRNNASLQNYFHYFFKNN